MTDRSTALGAMWHGVMPATTTPFCDDGSVDLDRVRRHAAWLVQSGCTALIAPGSLGEGQALEAGEREALWAAHAEGAGAVPVVAAIGHASTSGACMLAERAARSGCRGLMILPPYCHSGDVREAAAHISAVAASSALPAMVYNNPAAYRADLTPEAIAAIVARCPTVRAAKDSSGDLRRIVRMVAMTASGDLPPGFAPCVGLDDGALDGALSGAVGWVAGLVNALPAESVRLWECARRAALGHDDAAEAEARAIHAWFLPLLLMDTVPDFVQRIKLVQAAVRGDSAWLRVRAPRLGLEPAEAQRVRDTLDAALQSRPSIGGRRR